MSRLIRLDATRTGSQAQDLARKLHSLVIGQDDAIHQIVTAYQTYLAGLTPIGRPIANFLFLGSTGSGKTNRRGYCGCLAGEPPGTHQD